MPMLESDDGLRGRLPRGAKDVARSAASAAKKEGARKVADAAESATESEPTDTDGNNSTDESDESDSGLMWLVAAAVGAFLLFGRSNRNRGPRVR